MFTISAFGDEIADDLQEQLRVLNELNITGLDLRGVWGKNVLELTDDEVAMVKQQCADHGVHVPSLGSPIGKSKLSEPAEKELANLDRMMHIGDALDTKRIRVFSFYPDDISTNAHYDQYVDEVTDRLGQLTQLAASNGFTLLLENEKEIVGDTVDRCHTLLTMVNSPNLRFVWDPANFVQVDEANVTHDGWPLLGEFTEYVHVKDAMLSDGSVKAAGEGDGQVGELLTKLNESGYEGYLSLEPHLAIAGHSSGFSGPDGMAYAVKALQGLMEKSGCQEKK